MGATNFIRFGASALSMVIVMKFSGWQLVQHTAEAPLDLGVLYGVVKHQQWEKYDQVWFSNCLCQLVKLWICNHCFIWNEANEDSILYLPVSLRAALFAGLLQIRMHYQL